MADTIPQTWFEMENLRRRRFARDVWVPLRAAETIKTAAGGEETFLAFTAAFPADKRAYAEQLRWDYNWVFNNASPCVLDDGEYKTCEVFDRHEGENVGINLVFQQHIGGGHDPILHLSHDLILALKLLREGDVWIRPEEGYVEVARQRFGLDGKIVAVEIKNEFLCDYLAARGLALRIAFYRQRKAVLSDISHISWSTDGISVEAKDTRFKAQVYDFDPNAGLFAGGLALFECWRTDIDHGEDVPTLDPASDQNMAGRSATYVSEPANSYRVEGELWQQEWIEPSPRSERVRGDDDALREIEFIVDASGQREPSIKLYDEDVLKYLWFDPQIILALMERRGSNCRWYTAFAGSVWAFSDFPVHFGVNSLGLINVYAIHIARLPVWQQRFWERHNISPDGGVSSELSSAQMETRPAGTKAPEAELPKALEDLDRAAEGWLDAPLFRQHEETRNILRKTHRFRALEQNGLLALGKDITRLIAERIDLAPLRKVAAPPKGEKLGSLKSLEKALSTLIAPEEARAVLTPIAGAYELRSGDAHLPSARINEAFSMAEIDLDANSVEQGRQLIDVTVRALRAIQGIIESA